MAERQKYLNNRLEESRGIIDECIDSRQLLEKGNSNSDRGTMPHVFLEEVTPAKNLEFDTRHSRMALFLHKLLNCYLVTDANMLLLDTMISSWQSAKSF